MKLLMVVCMIMCAVMADGWEYTEKITNMGSRSEGRIGILKYNGFELPGKIGKILTPEGGYTFVRSTVPWGSKGWQTDKEIKYSESEDKFSAKLHDKWYKGPRLKDTPEGWCYLPVFDSWVNQLRLREYCLTELKKVKDVSDNPFGDLFGEGIEREKLTPLTPVDKPVNDLSEGWKHTVKITNQGSRSEGSIGILKYKGFEIPDRVGKIYTPSGSYYYADSQYLWGDKGWMKFDYAPESGDGSFTDCKWYKGLKKKGTPADWCYLGNLDTWIDPDCLKEYLGGAPKKEIPDFLEKIPPKRGKN